MAINKINIQKIKREDGFDTYDLLRIGRTDEFDNQKLSAVIHTVVETINQLIDENEKLKLAVGKLTMKGGRKKASTKSQ